MGTTRPMNLMDAAMLLLEKPQMPMHIGGASVFRLPHGAGPDFVLRLYERWLAAEVTRPPLNYRVARTSLTSPLPSWAVLEHVDIAQHLFHEALPYPGGDRELSELIGRLQSERLDMSRPLWQVHLIEGLRGSRFALYVKLHHALADGLNAGRILMTPYSEDPASSDRLPPWASPPQTLEPALRPAPFTADRVIGMAQRLVAKLGSPHRLRDGVSELASHLHTLADLASQDAPAPDSPLNRSITARRLTDSVTLNLARVRELGLAGGGTVNDVALAVCSGALRRYLQDLGQLPAQPLRCLVPVALRGEARAGIGNAATSINVTLATDVADAARRFVAIRDATRAAKASLQNVASDAVKTLNGLRMMLPLTVEQWTGIRGLGRSPFNLAISNVPGPPRKLYLYGAEMERVVASFIIGDGMALSILVTSYDDQLCLTFTACPDTLPEIDHFPTLLRDSFADLERALRSRDARSRTRRRPRAATK